MCWPSPCGGRPFVAVTPDAEIHNAPAVRPAVRLRGRRRTRQGVGPFDGQVKGWKPTRRRRCRPLHQSTSSPGGYRQSVRGCAERRASDGARNREPNSPSQPGTRRECGRPAATGGGAGALSPGVGWLATPSGVVCSPAPGRGCCMATALLAAAGAPVPSGHATPVTVCRPA